MKINHTTYRRPVKQGRNSELPVLEMNLKNRKLSKISYVAIMKKWCLVILRTSFGRLINISSHFSVLFPLFMESGMFISFRKGVALSVNVLWKVLGPFYSANNKKHVRTILQGKFRMCKQNFALAFGHFSYQRILVNRPWSLSLSRVPTVLLFRNRWVWMPSTRCLHILCSQAAREKYMILKDSSALNFVPIWKLK